MILRTRARQGHSPKIPPREGNPDRNACYVLDAVTTAPSVSHLGHGAVPVSFSLSRTAGVTHILRYRPSSLRNQVGEGAGSPLNRPPAVLLGAARSPCFPRSGEAA